MENDLLPKTCNRGKHRWKFAFCAPLTPEMLKLKRGTCYFSTFEASVYPFHFTKFPLAAKPATVTKSRTPAAISTTFLQTMKLKPIHDWLLWWWRGQISVISLFSAQLWELRGVAGPLTLVRFRDIVMWLSRVLFKVLNSAKFILTLTH